MSEWHMSMVAQFMFFQIKPDSFLRMLDMYKVTLASFGYELWPRYYTSKSFHNRVDSLLVLMARQAVNLTNLVNIFRYIA